MMEQSFGLTFLYGLGIAVWLAFLFLVGLVIWKDARWEHGDQRQTPSRTKHGQV